MNYMLTNKGLDLNAKLQSSTGATLKLTGAKGGVGYTVNPGELEDLLNIKQNLQLEEVQQDGNTVTYVIVLSNVGNDEEYVLTQIGLYAEDPDTGEEILYVIGQDARGERIPAIGESQVEYKFNVAQKISNASTVVFDTSPSDFTSKKTFEELRTKFDGHVNDTKNPHGVTAEQAGAAPKEHTHRVKDITEIMPLSKGGTGASTAEDARANMGAAAVNHSHQVTDIPFANNLITTAAGFLLDARQGKVLDEKISVSKAMVSDAYDVDADYAVGDYCIYDNVLHRCIEAVAAGSGWTPMAWMETSIEQELSTLNSNLNIKVDHYDADTKSLYLVSVEV